MALFIQILLAVAGLVGSISMIISMIYFKIEQDYSETKYIARKKIAKKRSTNYLFIFAICAGIIVCISAFFSSYLEPLYEFF